MVNSAPRLSQRLIDAIALIDEPDLPIAEIRRRVGLEADRLGVPRPSCERVRELVHESRRLRARVNTRDVLLDVTTRTRPPGALLEHISGVGVPTQPKAAK